MSISTKCRRQMSWHFWACRPGGSGICLSVLIRNFKHSIFQVKFDDGCRHWGMCLSVSIVPYPRLPPMVDIGRCCRLGGMPHVCDLWPGLPYFIASASIMSHSHVTPSDPEAEKYRQIPPGAASLWSGGKTKGKRKKTKVREKRNRRRRRGGMVAEGAGKKRRNAWRKKANRIKIVKEE